MTARSAAWALGALLAAAACFYGVVWPGAPFEEPDSAGYLEIAADLQAHGGLSRVWSRPPGYPLLLVATGSAPTPGRTLYATQLALHLVAVGLLWIALGRAGARPALRTAFAALALLPPFVEHAAFTLTESLAQLQLVLGIAGTFVWIRGGGAGWLVAACLAVGSALLVHPTYAVASPTLALGIAALCLLPCTAPNLRSRILRASMALIVAFGVGSGGFLVHNAARFGYVGVSPMLGIVLSHKTGRVLERIPEEHAAVREILIRARNELLVRRDGDHLAYAYVFQALPALRRETGLDDVALDRLLTRLQLGLIARSPLEYGDEVGRSLLWYFSPGVSDFAAFGSGALKGLWHLVRAGVLALFAGTLALLAGPAWLLLAARRREGAAAPPLPPGLAASCGFLALGAAVVGAEALTASALTSAVWRMRVPVDLVILACALLGAQTFRALAAHVRVTPVTPRLGEAADGRKVRSG